MLIKHVGGEVGIRLSVRILVVLPYFLQAAVVMVVGISMPVNMPMRI